MEKVAESGRMRGQGGFTLIELLVVVAILAILAGVAVFAVGNLTDDADKNACKVEKDTIKTAIASAKATSDPNDTWATFIDGGATATKYWTVTAGTISAKGTLPNGCS